MDLVVTTSPIIQEDFIHKAIESVYHIHFNRRFIICDGTTNESIQETYSKYKDNLKERYPDFEIIESDRRKWFIGSIKDIINISDSDCIFCIQHDTILYDKFCPHTIWKDRPKDSSILFFPEHNLGTKKGHLGKPHHWWKLVESYNQEWYKTIGWTERVFMFDRKKLSDILKMYQNERFIERICFNQTRSKWGKDNPHIIWDIWKCYGHKRYFHKHLVGKTLR